MLLFTFGKKIKRNMSKTKITINSNGSMRVEGDFEIVDKSGNTYDLGGREIIGICRCGLSSNKPFVTVLIMETSIMKQLLLRFLQKNNSNQIKKDVK